MLMSETVKTVLEYAKIPGLVVAFLGLIGLLYKLFTKLGKINEKIESVPMLTKTVKEVKTTCEGNKKEMENILKNLKEMRQEIDTHVEQDKQNSILSLWQAKKYLLENMKKYIQQKHISSHEMAKLKELFEVYESLGGNSEAALLYGKVCTLPLTEEWEEWTN